MASKTEAYADRATNPIALDHLCIERIVGADALGFMQRQSMNDVNALQRTGDAQWSGLLSAKGRVLHLFRLVRGENGLLAILPRREREGFRDELLKFRLRSKVEIESDARCPQGLWRGPGDSDWAGARALRLSAPAVETDDAAQQAGLVRWCIEDWASHIIWMDDASRDRFTPQMMGLQRLQAFSLKKGCYPGQEVVARTHYLGKGKRRLIRVESDAPLRSGEDVECAGNTIGTLLGVLDFDRRKAFAVIPETGDGAASLTLQTHAGATLRMVDFASAPQA